MDNAENEKMKGDRRSEIGGDNISVIIGDPGDGRWERESSMNDDFFSRIVLISFDWRTRSQFCQLFYLQNLIQRSPITLLARGMCITEPGEAATTYR